MFFKKISRQLNDITHTDPDLPRNKSVMVLVGTVCNMAEHHIQEEEEEA